MMILEIIQNISIIFASWSVLYGIDAWRREYRGKRQIELAENTLALFYEASDAIKHIRSPMSWSSETEGIVQGEKESDAQFNARKMASVVYKRYETYQNLFNKIYASRYRFMAQIGKDKAIPFDDLRKITNKILSSATALSKLWAKDYFRTDEQREKHFKDVEKYEAIFWDGYGDDIDPINPKLEKCISDIEIICNSIISGQGTLFGVLNTKIKVRFRKRRKKKGIL